MVKRAVVALLAFALVLIVAIPYTSGAPTKFPGFTPKNTGGSPPLTKLLSKLGTVMPTASMDQESAQPTSTSGVTLACRFSSPFLVGGVATGPGGQFVERWDTGDLWFYNTTSRTCRLIHYAPSGARCTPGSQCGYIGMASKGSLVALISWDREGLWTCAFSSTGHCTSVSAFISLPSVFCSSMPSGFCNPDGAAIDAGGNFWYVDVVNGVEVELTAASHYTRVGTVFYYGMPIDGIAIDLTTGNHWVSDYTCAGNVYRNRALVSSAGDALGSIALSNLNPSHTTHVYVGVTAECGNYPGAFVGDQNEFVVLPTPFSSANPIPGISTRLFFSDLFGHVWSTRDTV
jgi:hypothetical protein